MIKNDVLHTIQVDNALDALKIEEEFVTLLFDGGDDITLSTHHDQDCCEHVYGDFSIFKYHETQLAGNERMASGAKLKEIVIKAVADTGILVCFEFYGDSWEKVLVPCYNYQNGYYSSQLSMKITKGKAVTEVDVSGAVEDHIN